MGSRLVISRNGEILKISVEEYMAHYANEFNSDAQHKIESSKGDWLLIFWSARQKPLYASSIKLLTGALYRILKEKFNI